MWWCGAILFLGGGLLHLLKPDLMWKIRWIFTTWMFKGGEAPEPSRAALIYYRIVGGVLIAIFLASLASYLI